MVSLDAFSGFEPDIPEVGLYNARMAQSMIDKCFFLDKLDCGLIVDYGCADGILLKYIRRNFPGYRLIGFDISESMLDLARRGGEGITWTSDWELVVEEIAKAGQPACLVLNSVVHEARTYLTADALDVFWKRVWDSGFAQVAIRDMMVNRATSRPADSIAVARVHQCFESDRLAQWEAQWGSLTENWSLVHFFLTYRYQENWARELKENYLPVALEDFLSGIPKAYFPDFIEHYTLPFLRHAVMKDFGIQLQDRTHLKIILKHQPITEHQLCASSQEPNASGDHYGNQRLL